LPDHKLRNATSVEYPPVVMDNGIPDPRVGEDVIPQNVLIKRGAIDHASEILVYLVQKVFAANIR